MLEQDIPRSMPVPPVLRRIAYFLDAYNMSCGVHVDYHAAPDDGDITEFAVYAPSPAGDFMQGRLLVATVKEINGHYRFHGVRRFRGKRLTRDLTPYQFRKHVTTMGDRLESYGQPRARLADYHHLLTTWDSETKRYASLANILTVMRLPLELFDKAILLSEAPELLQEVSAVAHMPTSYIESLFALEKLREQDLIYRTMKKHGRVRPQP